MRKLKDGWRKKSYGAHLEPSIDERMTNLRFADDILLIASSLPDLTAMLTDLCTEAGKIGLELHPDKTKILPNNHTSIKRHHHPNNVTANGMKIDVLPPSSHTKYLGRNLTFSNDHHRAEIENRIAFGWKKFFVLKQELTSKRYSLSDRLRLFHGTVTPTVLSSCETWTLTTDLENRLRRTQRQMLRMILQSP